MGALAGLDGGGTHAGAHGKEAMTNGPGLALDNTTGGTGIRERKQAMGLTGSDSKWPLRGMGFVLA